LALQFVLVVVDAVFVFLSPTPWWAPLIVFTLATVAEVTLLFFKRLYGEAEALLRKLDARKLLGWAITPEEVRDLIKTTPQKLCKLLQATEEEYFASKQPVGAKRTIEGIQESAWWSKELAGTMAIICAVVTSLLVVASLGLLWVSLNTVQGPDAVSSISKLVSSVLTVIFSLGLLNLAIDYRKFSVASDKVECLAAEMIKSKVDDEAQAVKLMNQYHLARASAPPVPSWLWRLRNQDLNTLWEQYRASSSP